jgi:lysophospholipase L1-like esterase
MPRERRSKYANDAKDTVGIASQVESLSSSLAQKATKGEIVSSDLKILNEGDRIGLANLKTEVLTAMAGTTPILSQVADWAVKPINTSFFKSITKNLFDKSARTVGQYIDHTTGNLIVDATRDVSDYIPVEANTSYRPNYYNRVIYYDVSKTFISGIVSAGTFTTPTNAKYMRMVMSAGQADTFQVVLGSVMPDYEPYKPPIISKENLELIIGNKNLETKSVSEEKTTFINKSDNLYNGSFVRDKYLNGTVETNSVGYGVTDWIIVNGLSNIIATYVNWYAFYDVNKVPLSSGAQGTNKSAPIAVPANAYYVKLSTSLSYFEGKYMVNSGTTLLPYQPYYILTGSIIPDEFVKRAELAGIETSPYKTLQRIISKLILSSTTVNINLIGDSITAGVGGTGYNENDLTLGYNWANQMKSYFENKFNCTVTNSGISGITSTTIKSNIASSASNKDIIICMIGTNDRAAANRQLLYDNLKYVHDYVVGLGKQIIFMSAPPASVANEETKTMHMEDVDNIIMKVASDTNRQYISLYKLVTDYCKSNGITIDSLLGDGLHPNDTGYDVMFYLICKELGIATKRPGATW